MCFLKFFTYIHWSYSKPQEPSRKEGYFWPIFGRLFREESDLTWRFFSGKTLLRINILGIFWLKILMKVFVSHLVCSFYFCGICFLFCLFFDDPFSLSPGDIMSPSKGSSEGPSEPFQFHWQTNTSSSLSCGAFDQFWIWTGTGTRLLCRCSEGRIEKSPFYSTKGTTPEKKSCILGIARMRGGGPGRIKK